MYMPGVKTGRPRRRWALPVAVAATVALHVGLVAYFAPPRLLFSKEPVLTTDFALHVYQVDRALGAFRGWGKLWAYDPRVLAGQPAGVVEDLTSKGTELFVIFLAKLGVHPGLAFNLFILLVHLGLPAAAWASARLFRLSRSESAVVLLLWVLMWFFDSFLRWSWWIGMITWSADCYLAVLYVALLHRALEDRKPWLYLALVPLGAALTLIHPFGALGLLLPCALLYARRARSLAPVQHLLVALAVLAAASTALVWIGPLIRFRHYVGDADTFFRPTAESLILDYFDLVKDWLDTGTPVRTMLRSLCFVAGGVCLWRWRKNRDSRVLPLAATILWTLGLAYLSGYSWHARQTQPYRQIGISMLAAAIPAAVLLRELLAPSALRELSRSARVLLVLALVLIVPRFVRTVIHYFPDFLPERVQRSPYDRVSSSITGLSFEARPFESRYSGPTEGFQRVRRWFLDHHGGRGRVVLTQWVLGEYLAASTTLPILGGLRERNVPHVDAHPLRHDPEGMKKPQGFARYLERYAVGWVVVDGEFGPIDVRRDLLQPAESVDGFRIYRVRAEPSYAAKGTAEIKSQSLNSVQVANAAGPELVLRFHWMETLRCRPDCTIERVPEPGDRVGFIRVQNPPAAFEIYNEYD
jgi:hypothetical protein